MRKTRHAAVAVNQEPRTLSSAIIRAFCTGKTTARRVHAHADGRVGLALCRAVYVRAQAFTMLEEVTARCRCNNTHKLPWFVWVQQFGRLHCWGQSYTREL